MITPPRLRKGDYIGIIAPARKVSKEEIHLFIEQIESWGLKWKAGRNLFGGYNQFSGTDEERAADLQDMILDKDVKAIIFARGGYGSFRTLQLTDFAAFEKNPKWITGFSDITVFHSYVNKFLGIETIHSMMPLNFKEKADSESIESLRKALFGEQLNYQFESHPLNIIGECEAEIIGGNLSVICSLNGTVVFPELRRKILFIEDVDEYLYHIDRMIFNLSMSGSFNRAQAVIVGGFTDIHDNDIPFGKTYEEIIAESVRKYKIPLCFNFPAGHQLMNKAIIFGRKVKLNIEKDVTRLVFQSV